MGNNIEHVTNGKQTSKKIAKLFLDGGVFKWHGWISQKIQHQQHRQCRYRPSFLQNTPGWYNMTCNGFTTKPYLQIICILNIRAAKFTQKLHKTMSNAQFHDFP